MIHMISFNVNGLRAVLRKDFLRDFEAFDADLIALQEIKLQEGQVDFAPEGYHAYWNYAEKKGYSGTAIFTKLEPLAVHYGMGHEIHDQEGRLITLEYPAYYFITCYTPNSQSGLRRLSYRMTWEADFRAYLQALDAKKPVILCGDLNVAHEAIDLANPESNRRNAGFTDEERGAMTALLQAGFLDSFRTLYPLAKDRYTWWSYRTRARERNVGWRIDYFVVSERLRKAMLEAEIHDEVLGSDHCPVGLQLDSSLLAQIGETHG